MARPQGGGRRFRDEVGMRPVQWLTAQRLELAKQLLETTGLPVDVVTRRSGAGPGTRCGLT